jgi:uncharacterized protein
LGPKEYCLGWESGEDKMLVISVGTGSDPRPVLTESPDRSIPSQVPGLVSALMYGAKVDQDISCRTLAVACTGTSLTARSATLISRQKAPAGSNLTFSQRLALRKLPITEKTGKAFLYVRYNPELTDSGPRSTGLRDYNVEELLRMDLATPENMQDFTEVGAAARTAVRREHFGDFLE